MGFSKRGREKGHESSIPDSSVPQN
jgi:hypothetical protein